MTEQQPYRRGLAKFQWPGKEAFFAGLGNYTDTHASVIVREINNYLNAAGDFPLLTEYQAEDATQIAMRGLYVAEKMVALAQDQASVGLDKSLVLPYFLATHFYDSNQRNVVGVASLNLMTKDNRQLTMADLHPMSDEEISQLKIFSIQVSLNIYALLVRINEAGLKLESYPETLKEIVVSFENGMIEEAVHALYYASGTKNKRKLIRLVRDHFKPRRPSRLTDRGWSLWTRAIERSAVFWTAQFTGHYYPDSETHEDNETEVYFVKDLRRRLYT